ncbi:Acetyl-CoA synthetase (ADP-forming) alpha and beta chain (plasmid) [Cupriavidus sp. U2]|uniref:acetate--CoA ligase family protein n=1 Tax=Cupriavidus sp. U2 TaxID=2920269 RepID=UPI00129DDA19|nr:acetate--CoA ligase family protein [Cupriavidus sp. U2]KAI3590352.1 Acetyl-CoA synthetase (ADP-forming) alpha and beta chain [Cupriavidus sp. U2]
MKTVDNDKERPTGETLARALFTPNAVALVGASADEKKNTARPLRFMRKHGFQGRVFPVNAGRSEVMGLQAYPSVSALPESIDHAFVMVPGPQVAEALEQSAARGARVVTVFSDGFAEVGEAGMAAQQALAERARELGVRLLGPNSIGVVDVHSGAVLSVNAVLEMDTLQRGPVSVISQSGSMLGALLSRGAARGLGFAKLVSVGNESDIGVGELVDLMVDDAATEVILLFLETIRDAAVLGPALRRARAAGKPVLVYKLGRSEQGEALAQSHTGALAGNDAAVDAFLRKHGAMRVEMLETLFEAAPLALRYARHVPALTRAPRVAVVTTTGGGAATVVDRLGLANVEAVPPPESFVAHMAERSVKIRQTPIIDLTLAATSAQYRDLVEQMRLSDWCDAVLCVVGSSAQFHPQLAVKPIVEASGVGSKPLLSFLAPEAPQSLQLLQAAGVPAFRTPESCADALACLFRGAHVGADAAESCKPVAWPANLPKQGDLSELEAATVFGALGVPIATAELVTEGALQHAVPYPVVAKICSRDILHKTEIGGVQVGVRDNAELAAAADRLMSNARRGAPEARIDGILVQRMEDRLLELLLGFRNDPLVGPMVMLSAGGITAELHRDVSLRPAPVTPDEARQMIDEVRTTRLIRGFRGLPHGDVDALADAIVRFSHLAAVQGVAVAEAEINPLFVRADGVVGVDCVLRLAPGTDTAAA